MLGTRLQRASRFLFVLGLSCAVSGCLLGPDYQRPEIPLPGKFNVVSEEGTLAPSLDKTTVNAEWWMLFGDKTLDELVQQATKENADIQVALARLAMADALAAQAGSASLPSISLGASGVRANSGPVVSVQGVAVQANTSQLSLALSYELDVWGRVRRNLESATAVANSSRYDKDSIKLTVIALVSNLYLQLLSSDAQITVLHDSIGTRAQTLKVAQAKLQGGLVSPIDVYQASAALAAGQANLSEVTRQRALTQNQLGILTGKLDLSIPRGNLLVLPEPPMPPVGLPSTMLQSRPDVNRAEQDLRAANARIGVAEAGFFPSFSLSGLFGAQSVAFSAFLTDQSSLWSLGLSLTQPIFNGGLSRGRLAFANAEQQANLGLYVKVVRGAFGEVSDALASVRQTLETEEHLKQQIQAATQAQKFATLRYTAGYVDFLNVLEAQRTANEASLAFVVNRAARLQASVNLFKALGGGWVAQ